MIDIESHEADRLEPDPLPGKPQSDPAVDWVLPRQVTEAGRALARVAPMVPYLAFVAGVGWVVSGAIETYSNVPPTPVRGVQVVIGGASVLSLFGLAGLVVGCLLRVAEARLALRAARAAQAGAFERRVALALERFAEVQGRPEAGAATPAPVPAPAAKIDHASDIRLAIREARWEEAGTLVRAFAEEHPDDPEGRRLSAEFEEARGAAIEDVRAKMGAAREANDPDRVLELRDSVASLLSAEARHALNRELAPWFMGLIQKRLRAGIMRPDVAALAASVAERLDDTPEGASLRAALPTLRRSAGLCARCGKPYTGVADACPACLGAPSFPPPGAVPDLEDSEPLGEDD